MRNSEKHSGFLTRRKLLQAAALAAGGVALGSSPVGAAAAVTGARAVVAADGFGDFGPNTPGTKTSGIQEAIDAVHDRGGGTVLLRPGVYLVDAVLPPTDKAKAFDCGMRSILLDDNITLKGDGTDKTIIRTSAKCNTNAILGWETSNVCIEDLTVDGAGMNAGYGIAIFGMGTSFSDICLRRVKATGFGGSAIAVAGGQRVVVEQCTGANSKIGFEMGAPSLDYLILHCTAYGCTNGTLLFNPADKYNEMGNVRPRVIGGTFDGEGKASGVAMWDCYEPMVANVTALRGRTTNIQISRSTFPTIKTPVYGGLIEGCLAEGSIKSDAGAYGVGALQDGVRVIACTIVGNEGVGLVAKPEGGMICLYDCAFRSGEGGIQRYAISARGKNVTLVAQGNLHDGPKETFIEGIEALAVPGSSLAGNIGYNPVGLLPPADVPKSGVLAPNRHPYPVEVYIHSGKVSEIVKRDAGGKSAQVGSGPNARILLHPGEAIALRYTQRPKWSWFGE